MPILSAIFRGVDEMSSTLDRMASSGDAAVRQWERAGGAANTAFTQASDGAAKTAQSMNDAASSTDVWTAAIGNYDKGAMEAIYSTEELVEMGYKTQGALDAEAAAADAAADKINEVAKESKAASKESGEFGETAGGALQSLGNVLVSAGIVQGLREIVKGFAECSAEAAAFETSTAALSTIADTSEISLDGLSDSLIDLSKESGKAAGDLAEATYQAISSGVDTARAVEFTSTATKLAAGGFTESATAVDVLTTAINAYGLESSDATKISDMLITTQNLGKTTVDELASSVGKVIPVASAYGVEMDNLSAAYAVLTANGVATAESGTYLKTMLNELGDSSSVVAKTLQDETGMSFAELMAQGYSLGDVLDVLGDNVGGNATKFNELWSSTEAGIGALSLFNSGGEKFNSVLAQMQGSAGATAAAYTAMTNTTEFAQQKLSNSMNNLKITVGETLNPVVEKFSNFGSAMLDSVSGFLEKNPAVTAGIIGTSVALGAVAAAFAVYTVATTVATAVTTAFGVASLAALWPLYLVAAAIGAVVAVAILIADAVADTNAEFDSLTATSKQQYEQLEELNDEYDRAVEAYGENSDEARRLSEEISGLEVQYESCKMTLEEFIAENDALIESHDNLVDSYNSSMDSLDKEEAGTAALIGRLETLASKTALTASEQQQMAAIIDRLNEQVPELALNYDDFAGSVDKSIAAVRTLAEAEAKKKRQEAQYSAYVDLLADQTNLELRLAKATDEAAAAQERYANGTDWEKYGWWGTGELKKELDELTGEQDRLQAEFNETENLIKENEEAFAALAQAAEEAAKMPVDSQTAVSRAVQFVSDDIKELAASYDEAYAAARESIDGQIGLFDTMATETELSVSDMQAAMQSQIEYLATYTENLQKAAEYGISEGLIASLSDGSEESAGYINAIIANIESLGGSTEGLTDEAAAFVESFNAQFKQVDTAKDQFAGTVAEMESQFGAKLDEIEGRMYEAIENMNMSEEAAESARVTIDSYVNKIRSMTGEAHDAAAAVAKAAREALGDKGVPLIGIPGFATGTTDAPDVFIAGEEGPELIVGAGGSTVFTADETSEILADASLASLDREAAEPAPLDISTVAESSETQLNPPLTKFDSPDIKPIVAESSTVAEPMEPRVNEPFSEMETPESNPLIAGSLENQPASNSIFSMGVSNFNLDAPDAAKTLISNEKWLESNFDLSVNATAYSEPPSNAIEAPEHAPTNFFEVSRKPLATAVPDTMEVRGENDSKITIEKKITLEIAGSGAIDVSGPYDEASLLSLLFSNLKPALIGLLKQEIYEEGDMAYEF